MCKRILVVATIIYYVVCAALYATFLKSLKQ